MQKALIPVLDKYKDEFLKFLEQFCVSYKVIGSSTVESPMWFQFRGLTKDREFIHFKSSNAYHWFDLKIIDNQDALWVAAYYEDIYEYFRDLKYDYIKNNHPTIYKELR